ncbi:MAG: nucleoside-diphosphate-sugar epimerase [Myxococcota bacterium]|jgi:nucleoside-diphosphate-sugar epimerase
MSVCITGATGFVGAHVTVAFLEAGIGVHAAVRSPDDPEKIGPLVDAAERTGTPLTFFSADLGTPGSFDAAVAGCDAVVHVAAVARLTAPDPQRQIVDPAVEGARTVLDAATRGGVRRVVLTSSVAAIGNYKASQARPLTEADWNEAATLDTDPYGLAKTNAERLAWAMAEAAPWDLVALNPSMVLGPVLAPRHAKASPSVVRDVLVGTYPAIPKLAFGLVDVRDLAAAHLAAVQREDAGGRHLLCAGTRWMRDIAVLLAEAYPERRIRTWPLPNLVMYLAAVTGKRVSLSNLRDMLGRVPQYDGSSAPTRLGVSYTGIDQTLRDTAASLVRLGLV